LLKTLAQSKSMERRRYKRRTVDRPAKMFVPQGGSLPCRIKDVSRGGAKLTFGWKGWLPGGFDLQDAFTGVRRAAQIVWRGVHGIGVRFIRVEPARQLRAGKVAGALTVWASLIGVVGFGSTAGSMLPFGLRRLGFDPATSSAPFVATLVDVTGLVIYFTIASIILRGLVL
jgi:hypothetical protein